MTFVFLPSYQSLFLYLHLKLANPDGIVAIARTPSLLRMLSDLGCDAIELPVSGTGNPKSPIRLWRDLRAIRKWCQSASHENTLVFGYNAYDLFGFFVAKEWRKHGNPVLYKDLDPLREKLQFEFVSLLSRTWWKCQVTRLTYFLLGNLRHLALVRSVRSIVGIKGRFLRRYGIGLLPGVSHDFVAERLAVSQRFQLRLGDRLVLYVADHSGNLRQNVEWSSVASVTDFLVDQVVAKLHPREPSPELFERFTLLPSYIPAEFYLQDARAMVSISSTVLLQAATLPGVVAVSLLDLVAWKEATTRELTRDFLLSGKASSRIKFPKTLDELRIALLIAL